MPYLDIGMLPLAHTFGFRKVWFCLISLTAILQSILLDLIHASDESFGLGNNSDSGIDGVGVAGEMTSKQWWRHVVFRSFRRSCCNLHDHVRVMLYDSY